MTKPSTQISTDFSIWAVVPAAGIGQRMLSDIPKQYLPLHGATVLEHTLNRLLSVDAVNGLAISLQPHDKLWDSIQINSDKPVLVANGGAERSDSVLNALNALLDVDGFDESRDWVLVHDAVRPCVRISDIELLITEVGDSESGGLLALPVRDTMKRQVGDEQMGVEPVVQDTVDRDGLWHALTPQLFPYRVLRDALLKAVDKDVVITDESSAVEHVGLCPLLVQGHEDNIKITRPDDLRLAELYLQEAGE
jgi:2-C-methyl-D-erythritol 4-phosphate cytidylyltransferase